MSAYDDRVRELYRLPKTKLAALYDSRHTFVYLVAPLTRWSKDELISAILEDEFPQGRPAAVCVHEHVEQVGTDALGNPITECLACGDGAGELITDPAEIEQIKAQLQYAEGQYEVSR